MLLLSAVWSVLLVIEFTRGLSPWLQRLNAEYWPRTPEGRLLCLLLAIHAFAVFGYVTAAIAAYFVDKNQNERLA